MLLTNKQHSSAGLSCRLSREQGQRFRVKDKTYGQFSDNYFNRLARLRPVLLEVAKREFPETRGERFRGCPLCPMVLALVCASDASVWGWHTCCIITCFDHRSSLFSTACFSGQRSCGGETHVCLLLAANQQPVRARRVS